jgi:hypothetical protein
VIFLFCLQALAIVDIAGEHGYREIMEDGFVAIAPSRISQVAGALLPSAGESHFDADRGAGLG